MSDSEVSFQEFLDYARKRETETKKKIRRIKELNEKLEGSLRISFRPHSLFVENRYYEEGLLLEAIPPGRRPSEFERVGKSLEVTWTGEGEIFELFKKEFNKEFDVGIDPTTQVLNALERIGA